MYKQFLAISFITLSASIQLSCVVDGLEEIAGNERRLNILMVGDPLRSHLATLLTVGEELAHRGHNVTLLVIVFERDQAAYQNVAEKHKLQLWNVSAGDLAQLDLVEISKNVSKAFFTTMMGTMRAHGETMTNIMVTEVNRTLSEDNWDIVLGNSFMQNVMACMQSAYKLPFVSIGVSLDIGPYDYPPWSYPGLLEGAASDDMKFTDRFVGVFSRLLHKAFYLIMYSHPLTDYCPSMSTTQFPSTFGHYCPRIVPTSMGLQYPLTTSPLVHYVGPLVSRYPSPLTGDLKDWLMTKPEKSVVYISMGSVFAPTSKEMGKSFLEGVLSANYSVLWSLRKSSRWILEGLDIDPERVFISEWTPQFSVLGSEAIHSAILHGGFSGLSEALWNGVPVLVVPQMHEQQYNGGHIHFNGLGILLDTDNLSSTSIAENLRALDTGEYRAKVSKLQKVFRNAGGVRKAADLVEFYEDVGYAHLVPAYAKYNWSWVQYYNVDAYFLIMLIVVTIATCLVTCCKYTCKRCCSSSKNKHKKD